MCLLYKACYYTSWILIFAKITCHRVRVPYLCLRFLDAYKLPIPLALCHCDKMITLRWYTGHRIHFQTYLYSNSNQKHHYLSQKKFQFETLLLNYLFTRDKKHSTCHAMCLLTNYDVISQYQFPSCCQICQYIAGYEENQEIASKNLDFNFQTSGSGKGN